MNLITFNWKFDSASHFHSDALLAVHVVCVTTGNSIASVRTRRNIVVVTHDQRIEYRENDERRSHLRQLLYVKGFGQRSGFAIRGLRGYKSKFKSVSIFQLVPNAIRDFGFDVSC
jgi:hypothetical protein